MFVTKRSGKKEAINFDKINARIKKMSYGLESTIDIFTLTQQVISGLYENVSTVEIDTLIAESAAAKSTHHFDYATLAGRITVSSLHKTTEKSFFKTVKILYNNIDNITKEKAPLVSKEFYDYVRENNDILDSIPIYDRDFDFDYFAIKTLQKSYLLRSDNKVVERPQHMLLRVAIAIHLGDIDKIRESYELMSGKWFTHATPTLFNAGTPRPQLSSCFLLHMEDSISGMYKTLSDCAQISKYAGGIGIDMSKIRGVGSYIKGTGGTSNGIIPMLKVFNEAARHVDQGGGRRKGSIAMYIEPWHNEIFEFLDLKKNHGKEEMRARDLFYALWISDLFMKRVQANEKWTLFSPDQVPMLTETYGDEFEKYYIEYESKGLGFKTIDAQVLWNKIIETITEVGQPYLLSKDSINNKSNQKNLGIIRSSNLCVAGDTKILTKNGYINIGENENNDVEVWNGNEWSKTKIVKTGENQELLEILFSNGQLLKCTPYHKFYIQKGYHHGVGENKLEIIVKEAKDLKVNDKLIKLSTEVIEFDKTDESPYTQGFFSGDGCRYNGKNHIDLYGDKIKLIPYLDVQNIFPYSKIEDRQRVTINNDFEKFYVPTNTSVNNRILWLAGLCDSDGTITRNGKSQSIQISSTNIEFLREIHLMFQTLGIQSKINNANEAGSKYLSNHKNSKSLYLCEKSYRLLIGSNGIRKLLSLGFKTNRLIITNHISDRNLEQFVKVLSVCKLTDKEDTYCVNEPINHKAVFNGILTGNCTEIVEYTSKDETAVCNLASLSLPKFVIDGKVDYQKLYDVTRVVTRNLNKVIDVNYYPTKEAENSNVKHRPIGIGVQGLADLYLLLKLPFTSDKAKEINKDIFETMYYAALSESLQLAKENGKYDSFDGSPISKGIFQFDMWNVKPSNRYDWETLRKEIIEHGIRNSLLLAPMPTASTSQILGNNEAFEAYTSNMYTRRTLSGEFIVINKHLVKDLISLGLWDNEIREAIIHYKGSIQNIDVIPQDIKDLYKTVWEMSMRDIIDMSADRGAFICQSQSLNLFMETITNKKLSSMYFYAWSKGLKTIQYYLRSRPAVDPIKFTLSEKYQKKFIKQEETTGAFCTMEDGCIMCSG